MRSTSRSTWATLSLGIRWDLVRWLGSLPVRRLALLFWPLHPTLSPSAGFVGLGSFHVPGPSRPGVRGGCTVSMVVVLHPSGQKACLLLGGRSSLNESAGPRITPCGNLTWAEEDFRTGLQKIVRRVRRVRAWLSGAGRVGRVGRANAEVFLWEMAASNAFDDPRMATSGVDLGPQTPFRRANSRNSRISGNFVPAANVYSCDLGGENAAPARRSLSRWRRFDLILIRIIFNQPWSVAMRSRNPFLWPAVAEVSALPSTALARVNSNTLPRTR